MTGFAASARRAALAAAWAALAWVGLLGGLGSFGLVGPDEPRYAAIAAAMLRRGDWITPRLWGAPWFEKPVLFYWLAGLSDALTHVGAAAARRPNALLAVAMCAALGLFLGRWHSPRAGWLAAFLGLSSAFVIGFGRAATTDMTLTAPLTAAFLAGYAWWQTQRRSWLAGMAVALGFAVLAKGPVAVALLGLAALGFAATQRGLGRVAGTLRPLPLALFFAVAAPWYAAVQTRQPGFFRIFFLQHNLERFATNRFEHPQVWWFYGPVLLLGVFPWTGWLLLPLGAAARRWRERGWRRFWDARDAPLKMFLGLWVLTPVVFFTLSRSKLPGYILPAIPAAIALAAVVAAERWERFPLAPLALSGVLAGLIPAAVRLAPWALAPRGLRPPLGPELRDPGVAMLAAATVFLMLVLALRRRTAAVVAATCLLMAGAVGALTHGPLSAAVDVDLSGRPLARALAAQCGFGLPRACGTVPLYAWHLDRGILYGVQFGLDAELPEFSGPAPDPAGAIVLMDRGAVAEFQREYGDTLAMGRLSRLEPSGDATVPWLAVRVRRKQ